jgi:hypothetical protein
MSSAKTLRNSPFSFAMLSAKVPLIGIAKFVFPRFEAIQISPSIE